MSPLPKYRRDLDKDSTHERTKVSREAKRNETGLHEETKRSGAKEDTEVRRNEGDWLTGAVHVIVVFRNVSSLILKGMSKLTDLSRVINQNRGTWELRLRPPTERVTNSIHGIIVGWRRDQTRLTCVGERIGAESIGVRLQDYELSPSSLLSRYNNFDDIDWLCHDAFVWYFIFDKILGGLRLGLDSAWHEGSRSVRSKMSGNPDVRSGRTFYSGRNKSRSAFFFFFFLFLFSSESECLLLGRLRRR